MVALTVGRRMAANGLFWAVIALLLVSQSARGADATRAEQTSATGASFRMNDQGVTSGFPRASGKLLAELTDPTLPATATFDSGRPRALPPLSADLAELTPPPSLSLGAPCAGCETCGSIDNGGTCHTCCTATSSPAGVLKQLSQAAPRGGVFQNTQFFLAGDGWKNVVDDDHNNNFGVRTGFNMGLGMPGPHAVRGQIGDSYGAYDLHGREQPLQTLFPDLRLSHDDAVEQQVFATAGLYKRSRISCGDPLAWGAVYDLMYSRSTGDAADELLLGQLRGYVGYALNQRNEVGSWVAFRLMRDNPVHATLSPTVTETILVNVTDQANLFWHHTWGLGGDTVAYVGWADDPADLVFGLSGRVPLNHHAALFGNFHYLLPSTRGGDRHPVLGTDDVFTQEAWNVSFGIVFYRGAKAVSPDVSGVFGLPLLPVADNSTFSFQRDF